MIDLEEYTYRVLYAIHVMSWMRVCTAGADLVNGLSSAIVPAYVDEDFMVGSSYFARYQVLDFNVLILCVVI